MERGDRRLQGVGAGAPPAQRPLHERGALGDPRRVPAPAVLLGQRDHGPVGPQARGTAGVREEHQGEQPFHLGVARHEGREEPAEAQRLRAEVGPREVGTRGGRVALGEDDVDDRQDAGQALGKQVVRRDAVGDAGRGDLALGPGQALGHRRLGHQEGGRGLRGGQSPEELDREGDAGRQRQRGMTAAEDEPQAVVVEDREPLGGLLEAGVGPGRDPRPLPLGDRLERLDPGVEAAGAAQAVDRLAPRRGGQPGRRPVRRPVAAPGNERRRARVLQGVLGERDVAAEVPHEGREDGGAVLADRAVQAGRGARHPTTWTGRTSTAPYEMFGIFAAHASAASRSGTSMR